MQGIKLAVWACVNLLLFLSLLYFKSRGLFLAVACIWIGFTVLGFRCPKCKWNLLRGYKQIGRTKWYYGKLIPYKRCPRCGYER